VSTNRRTDAARSLYHSSMTPSGDCTITIDYTPAPTAAAPDDKFLEELKQFMAERGWKLYQHTSATEVSTGSGQRLYASERTVWVFRVGRQGVVGTGKV
jgi:hypothetical protein